MKCEYCGFALGDDDHRCQRCGRRVSGRVIAAPPGYSGANALAVTAKPTLDTQEWLLARGMTATPALPPQTRTAELPAQPVLFAPPGEPPRKVIQFDQWQRQQSRLEIGEPARPAPKATRKKKHTPGKTTVEQATLDFIPAPPSKGKKLKTEVDAQIYCDQPVAPRLHRCIAASIDAGMIFIAFGVVAGIVLAAGAGFGSGKQFWMTLGAAFALVAMFYGMFWAIVGRETIGMRTTDLQLLTFDGFPVDGPTRALRLVSAWLSFCSAGLGLLWAVADEESLTWHDHISKTFPTVRETPRTFVKQRP